MNAGTCKHYAGMLHTFENEKATCKAGVCFVDKFGPAGQGIMLKLPCIQFRELPLHGRGTYIRAGEPTKRQEIERRGFQMIPCDKLELPTPEEIEADRRDWDRAFARTMAALKIAGEWKVKPKPEQDRQDVLECPTCKGKLHVFQSAHNGHCSGKCETPGCVEWME